MTRDEFITAYPPCDGDTVVPCHCDSCDCPGWKLITPLDRRIADAMDRLPEVIAKAAYDYGHQLAMKREQACLEALIGRNP